MTARFGYGFEERGENSPSTQLARAYFLALLSQLKPEVVPALFDVADQPFLKFLTSNEDEIQTIKRNIEPVPYSMHTAIRIFTSGGFANRNGGGALNDALRKWAGDWNLTDDWCLEHAFKTLRGHYLSPSDHSYQDAWHNAHVELEIESLCIHAATDVDKLREIGLGTFSFKHEEIDFTVEGPLLQSIADFKQVVEKKFKDTGGQDTKGARRELQYQVDKYLEKVRKAAKELNLAYPPRKLTTEHFKWLIEHQIPPRMTVPKICEQYGLPLKTIADGLKSARKLIHLSPPTKSLKGRKTGKGGTRKLTKREEDNRQRRLSKFIEALGKVVNIEIQAEAARAIGVSENYFRREWVPGMIEEAGCSNYESLVRWALAQAQKHH
jgi:hypothetical protein